MEARARCPIVILPLPVLTGQSNMELNTLLARYDRATVELILLISLGVKSPKIMNSIGSGIIFSFSNQLLPNMYSSSHVSLESDFKLFSI